MKRIKLIALIITVLVHSAHAQYSKIIEFAGTDGKLPMGSLISDGTFLYGMTSEGGPNNPGGVIFKVKNDGSDFTHLYDFDGTANALNGNAPQGSLLSDGTYLYGMTSKGGLYNNGVIFRIKNDGTGYTKFLDFDNANNGSGAIGTLISDGTFLYGMTIAGGMNSNGVIFKIKKDGTGYVKIYDFEFYDANQPFGSLILDGSYLYGMSKYGGTQQNGVIFKIKTDGTDYSTLHSFIHDVSDGKLPNGDLIFDGSYFYGMTKYGGTKEYGIIFKIKVDGTGFTMLHDFDGPNGGSIPFGSLFSDGTYVYGMTARGGLNDGGVLFKIKTDGTGFEKLIDFSDLNGFWPSGSLISQGSFLYGMTPVGGTNNMGVIFKYQFNTTGIAENNDTKYYVFPNPNKGIFNLKMGISKEAGIEKSIEIYNVLGKVIFQSGPEQFTSSTIDISSQPAGIYFVNIKVGNAHYNQKILVQ